MPLFLLRGRVTTMEVDTAHQGILLSWKSELLSQVFVSCLIRKDHSHHGFTLTGPANLRTPMEDKVQTRYFLQSPSANSANHNVLVIYQNIKRGRNTFPSSACFLYWPWSREGRDQQTAISQETSFANLTVQTHSSFSTFSLRGLHLKISELLPASATFWRNMHPVSTPICITSIISPPSFIKIYGDG